MKRRPEETQYQLIAVGEDAATGLAKFESRRLLTDEEFRSYFRAVEHLLEYREFSTAFANLLNALIAFETHYSAVLSADAQLKDDREVGDRAKLVLNTQLESALSTLRAFLDRTQTRLSRRWGAKSEIVAHFKRVTAHEFDTTLAYRFFYKLRNYAQHCGAPIRMVAVESWIENPPAGPHRAQVRIDCSPRDLLRNYGEWGKVRADLEQFGDNVPLGSLAKELSDSVTRLYRAILEGEAPLYIASGECVVRLLVEVDSPGEHGAIAEVGPYEDGKQDVSFVEPPLDVLRLMGMIVDETG